MLRMPVYQILREMPYEEFLKWNEFLKRHPYEWRNDLRAYYIMQSLSGTKEPPEKFFPSLAIKSNRSISSSQEEKINIDKLKNSSMYGLLAQAVGGDPIPF